MIGGLDRLPTDPIEVRQRHGKPDCPSYMRRSGFETVRPLFPLSFFVGDSGDHFTAELVGLHVGKEVTVSVKNANARGPAAFMPGKNQEIASHFPDVNRSVTGTLCGINESNNSVF